MILTCLKLNYTDSWVYSRGIQNYMIVQYIVHDIKNINSVFGAERTF